MSKQQSEIFPVANWQCQSIKQRSSTLILHTKIFLPSLKP